MKSKIGILILIVVCLGLGIGLIVRNKKAEAQKMKDEGIIAVHSNQLVVTTEKLQDQEQVNRELTNQLAMHKTEIGSLSNTLNQTAVSLSKTEADLKAAHDEMARRDQRIAELETQNQVLDTQAIDLKAAIKNLETNIGETQRKLQTSEGDKAFLEKELQRLMAEKAELERQFNDLSILRTQVAKLKEELSIARRLEWIRRGLYGEPQKGAERLMQGFAQPAPARTNTYDLNVEVSADGTLKVIPPSTPAPAGTNAPAPK